MEWSMLLVAAVLAAAAVAGVHALRRQPHAAGVAPSRRPIAAEQARRAVTADAEAARKAAEDLSLEQRPRG